MSDKKKYFNLKNKIMNVNGLKQEVVSDNSLIFQDRYLKVCGDKK